MLSTLSSDTDSQAETTLINKPQEKSIKRRATNKRVCRKNNKSDSKIQDKSIKSNNKLGNVKTPHPCFVEELKGQVDTSTRDNQNLNRVSKLPIEQDIEDKMKQNSSSSCDIFTNINKTSTSEKKLVNFIFSTITKRKSSNNETDKEQNLDSDQSDAFEDKVPNSPSPPNKKARFIFQKCFQKTFDPRTLPGYNVILAEDSDEASND